MKRILSVLLALTMLLSASACSLWEDDNERDDKLLVHFIDVGQGDSILLESDDEFVLIDAGERDYGDRVLKYIEEQGADELSYVIATHPHTDHIGGLRTVLDGIDAEYFITAETDCETYSWTKLLKTVAKNDVRYLDAKPGDTYCFGEACFTILAPLSDSYEDYNNASVVVKVTCGDISFLLTGDAEKDSEADMIASGADLTADVLKCGHHGSSTSTSAAFLKAVCPEFAVISCGKYNSFGHPHSETLHKLKTLGCEILRTDRMGTVVASTDGESLCFSAADADLSGVFYTAGYKHVNPDALCYIGNKKSLVFHYPDCSGVANMNENNMITFTTRREALKAGYTPCSICQP